MTKNRQKLADGTASAPKYYEGFAEINGDVRQNVRYFSYKNSNGLLVTGVIGSVMFTIDRPVKDVWPYVKDRNLWMNSFGYYFPGVVGDLEGKTYRIASKPDDPTASYPFEYQVLKVVPEHLIVINQPVPEDGSNGGISPGVHVSTLCEYEGKTLLMFTMQHASGSTDMTEGQALSVWREPEPMYRQMWQQHFIPTLKRIVYEGK